MTNALAYSDTVVFNTEVKCFIVETPWSNPNVLFTAAIVAVSQ